MSKTRITERSLTINVTRAEITKHETRFGVSESRRPVPDGTLSGTVTLLIDIDALVQQLGTKALRSKGGRAREVGGLVEVLVDRRTLRREK